MGYIDFLRPWVQKVLPLVYDDSLSYYELLAKVTQKLNEVIQTTNSLNETIKTNLVEILQESIKDGTLGQAILDSISDVTDKLKDVEDKTDDLGVTVNNIDALKLKGKNAVFFGDSWTVGVGIAMEDRERDRYPKKVCDALGMIENNFAVGGSGFVIPNNTIADQVERARTTMTSDERNAVPCVFVLGGVNDMRHWEDISMNDSTWLSAVNTTINTMCTVFPNAVIYVGLCNSTCNYVSTSMLHRMEVAKRNVAYNKNYPICVMSNVHNWIRGFGNYYASDLLHPNALGHGVIAEKIVQVILGGETKVDYYMGSLATNSNAVSTQKTAYLWRNDNNMRLCASEYTFLTGITSLTLLGTIEAIHTPNSNVYGLVFFANHPVGTLAITPSGNVYVDPNEGQTITHFYAQDLTWFLYGNGTQPA